MGAITFLYHTRKRPKRIAIQSEKRVAIIFFFVQMLALLNLCQFFFSQQCRKCLFRGKRLGSFWQKLPYWGFKKCPIQCQHKKANTTSSENGSAMALDFKFFSLGCVYGRFLFGLMLEGKELWDYISH